MPREYFKDRLRAQEEEIESLRVAIDAATRSRNKKLLGVSERRLETAIRLREMYQRLVKCDEDPEPGAATGSFD
ncbi:MAG TPA: hypothetical protein VJH03_13330 [Blastocatellia bacterium]|nr:hypothetical protein [Blastocatellia bacterium]